MELERRDFRAMIYYDFKRGLKQEECYECLVRTFGDQSPSRATIFNWFAEFKRGRQSLKDEPHTGRIPSAVTPENIAAVKRMIELDRRVTYVEIQSSLGISAPAIKTILQEHLGVTKRCCRWIPHKLTDVNKKTRVDWCREMKRKFNQGVSRQVECIITGDETWIYQYDPETKQQSSVWCFQNENPPTKVIRSRSCGKIMVASFVSKAGHIASIPLEDRRTVTSDWYTTVCLPKVFQAWQQKHPRSGIRRILFHHDNASAHTALNTREFFEEKNVKILPHPPYSPDLAICDFFVFPSIKKKLRGIRFGSPEEALAAYELAISEVTEEEWKNVFQKWFHRMQLCIQCSGEYFEKL